MFREWANTLSTPYNAILDTYEAWRYRSGETAEGAPPPPSEPEKEARPAELTLEQIVENLRGIDIRSQGNFGTCVAHTVDHLVRFHYWQRIPRMNLYTSRHWVYAHRQTRQAGLDAGMSTIATLERVLQHRLLPEELVPYPSTQEDLAWQPNQIPSWVCDELAIRPPWRGAQYVPLSRWDDLANTLTADWRAYGLRAHALSVESWSGWWSADDVPRYGGTRYGGHAVAIMNAPTTLNGQPAFVVLDSAYTAGRVWRWYRGVRVLTPEYAQGLNYLSIVDWVENVGGKPQRLTHVARFGESGSHVVALQNALKALGLVVQPTGRYDEQTQAAVMAFFVNHRREFEKRGVSWSDLLRNAGRYWGTVSLEVYNTLYG